jgi:hypothetical protein
MAFSENTIQQVWEKARGLPGMDSAEWRQDQCGAWLNREQYNNADSDYGWKIENINAGNPEDLQPFHRENAYDIEHHQAHCRVTADRSGLAPTQSVDHPRNSGL